MGVDCKIWLPQNVRVRDVAKVVGALLGMPKRCEYFKNGSNGSYYAKVDGAKAESYKHGGLEACAHIDIEKCPVDGFAHDLMFHFECGRDFRLIMPRSTPLWIAVGRRLVDFFGGELDYNDCDDSECDYSAPAKSREENAPEDGDAWRSLQDRILAIEPLTDEEIDACDPFAAYHPERKRIQPTPDLLTAADWLEKQSECPVPALADYLRSQAQTN